MFDVPHVLERLKQVLLSHSTQQRTSHCSTQHCMHRDVLLVGLKAVRRPLLLVHASGPGCRRLPVFCWPSPRALL